MSKVHHFLPQVEFHFAHLLLLLFIVAILLFIVAILLFIIAILLFIVAILLFIVAILLVIVAILLFIIAILLFIVAILLFIIAILLLQSPIKTVYQILKKWNQSDMQVKDRSQNKWTHTQMISEFSSYIWYILLVRFTFLFSRLLMFFGLFLHSPVFFLLFFFPFPNLLKPSFSQSSAIWFLFLSPASYFFSPWTSCSLE